MSIWNYIGEFLLFRWLFGPHRHHETNDNVSETAGRPYDGCDCGNDPYADDFLDEQDDYDMLDDF